MEWLSDPQVWIAFVTLASLEIVLGIDNIIVISILAGKLPSAQQPGARLVGLALAMIARIGLLFALSWMASLTAPLIHILGQGISGRDLIFIGGGLFLLAKGTHEIHSKIGGEDGLYKARVIKVSFVAVIIQILLMDMVFSLDSVITAIGMANQIEIMIAAIVSAVLFMMLVSGPVSSFVNRYPTIRILALSFLLLIGFTLILDGFEIQVPKGYIYFAIAFSVFVEMLNLRMRKRVPRSVRRQNHRRAIRSPD